MPTLFERIVTWLARKAGSLLVILAILLAVGWIRSEWVKLVQVQAEIERAESIRDGLQDDVQRIDADITARQDRMGRADRGGPQRRWKHVCAGSKPSSPARSRTGAMRSRSSPASKSAPPRHGATRTKRARSATGWRRRRAGGTRC